MKWYCIWLTGLKFPAMGVIWRGTWIHVSVGDRVSFLMHFWCIFDAFLGNWRRSLCAAVSIADADCRCPRMNWRWLCGMSSLGWTSMNSWWCLAWKILKDMNRKDRGSFGLFLSNKRGYRALARLVVSSKLLGIPANKVGCLIAANPITEPRFLSILREVMGFPSGRSLFEVFDTASRLNMSGVLWAAFGGMSMTVCPGRDPKVRKNVFFFHEKERHRKECRFLSGSYPFKEAWWEMSKPQNQYLANRCQ